MKLNTETEQYVFKNYFFTDYYCCITNLYCFRVFSFIYCSYILLLLHLDVYNIKLI